MDIKDIRQLVKLMVENDLSELEIADGPSKVHLRRGADPSQVAAVAPGPQAVAPPAPGPAAGDTQVEPAENLVEIRSPMVGTFYTASSPDSEPYIQAGSAVTEDAVVCIVEAMKVMNEIKAECTGVVREVCVNNAQPVEFGQVLFRVKPS